MIPKTRIRFATLLLVELSLGMIVAAVPAQTARSSLAASLSNHLSTVLKQQTSPSLTGTYFDHVVMIMMENRGLSNICGSRLPPPCNGNQTSNKPATPFMASLANNFTLATQYRSIINTSAPNYVALIGGSTFNCGPGGCGMPGAIKASSLIDRLSANGLSWKAYFENYTGPSGCFPNGPSPYNYLHNPFIWFSDIDSNSTRCANLVNANPSSCTVIDCTLITDLNDPNPPSFAWLTPNDCNNMHGNSACTTNGCLDVTSTYKFACISGGENYLKTLVPRILNSTAFAQPSERSALFITFDEGTGNCPSPNPNTEDCVYAVWAGPVTNTGETTSNKLYNHYSFLKTVEANWNLTALEANDANATAMKEFFKPDFSISANPAAVTFAVGGSTTSTMTLSSLSGFNGTVALAYSSNPNGLSVDVNPSVVMLKAQMTNSSSITFSSNTSGNFTVTLTGTSGNLSHSSSVAVQSATGSVGGITLPIDKLGLVLQPISIAALVLVSLSSAILGMTVLRNRRHQKRHDETER